MDKEKRERRPARATNGTERRPPAGAAKDSERRPLAGAAKDSERRPPAGATKDSERRPPARATKDSERRPPVRATKDSERRPPVRTSKGTVKSARGKATMGSAKSAPEELIRLNRYISNSGVCARREADELIARGLIYVNGTKVTVVGTKVKATDKIEYQGKKLVPGKRVYILLNKPKGYVTTTKDPHAEHTVLELVRDATNERIYPVGRLDKSTTGVLLFTNDGDLAGKLIHPKFKVKKVYHVFLDKEVTKRDMEAIVSGVDLEDGKVSADAISYPDTADKTQVGVEIHSGQNRVVRRIFEHLGYKVTRLDRVFFAGLTKKNIERGTWRHLTDIEVSMLKRGIYK